MDQWISVLVALVCLSSPSVSRSWVGFLDQHDVNYDHELKSWHEGPHGYKPHHTWEHDGFSPDFDSSEEDSWEHDDDFNHHQGHVHGYEKKGHDGYPHHHETHVFNHHHGNYGYHHNHHGHNHQEHGQVNDDNKHQHGHPSQGAGSSSAKNSQGKTNGNEEKVNHVQPTSNDESTAQDDLSKNNQNKKQVPKNDTDQLVFPDRQARSSSTSSLPPPISSATTTTSLTTTTPAPISTPAPTAAPALLDIIVCVRACPVTSEYNPVCGSNNFTYNNPGVLECARNCGANVTLSRRAPCARPILEQGSTASPDAEVTETTVTDTTGPVETTQPPTTEAPVTASPTRFTDITDKLKLLMKL